MSEVNDYQNQTDVTAIYVKIINDYVDAAVLTPEGIADIKDRLKLCYVTLGLTGEAGEVANKVKKLLREDVGSADLSSLPLAEECGDVLWYAAQFARRMGWDLEQVLRRNVDKLHVRMTQGKLKGEGDSR